MTDRDFNIDPTYLRELLASLDEPRPFLDRVRLWLRSPLSWKGTAMRRGTIWGISTTEYPKWGAAPDTFGGKNVAPATPEDR